MSMLIYVWYSYTLGLMANVYTPTLATSELQCYLVSTRDETLADFVNRGDDSAFFTYTGHVIAKDKVQLWTQANNGKDTFRIGDKINIPGRAEARTASLDQLIGSW